MHEQIKMPACINVWGLTLTGCDHSIHRWIHITGMRLRFSPRGQVKLMYRVYLSSNLEYLKHHNNKALLPSRHATPFSAVMPFVALNWGCDLPEHKMTQAWCAHSDICLNRRDELH
ncbi:hypothetical protein D9C73_008674 [Collichthys lucidus]|uniref:Uncharacterized protein n=1 Tax=Collichthys lucidus TaxID=240159 RepID=A0A4U5UK15_COLLU|nr:hypothetical protein D9C73_008674 [Collichthys lucidus]